MLSSCPASRGATRDGRGAFRLPRRYADYSVADRVKAVQELKADNDNLPADIKTTNDHIKTCLRNWKPCGRFKRRSAIKELRAVEIDAAGWRVIDNPPIRFSIETLRTFLNVHTDADFGLVVAWMLACLRNRGPYPVLILSGEQGSVKSTFSAILRALLDPNIAPLRVLPRKDRDLFIAASNGHVLAFDNVSGLPAWILDTLYRLATGGGFAVRQLYSDQDEVLFDAARPVILNGIEDIVIRPDLADRAVFLTLEPILEERRRPEQELWAAFELERPRILGVLLDAVAKDLAMLSQICPCGRQRHADPLGIPAFLDAHPTV